MIFDTHAHYDNAAFDEDRDELLMSLLAAGIGRVVNVGASIESTKRTVKLTEEYPFIYGAAGVHPSESGEMTEEDIAWLEGLTRREKVVAVGEIGLDYYWKEPEISIQKHWFVRQLDLARRTKTPVIIHSRDAAKDTLDIMKAEKAGDVGGVISGNRGCFDLPKCQTSERGYCLCPFRTSGSGNGLSVPGPGSLSGKEKLFSVSAFDCPGSCRN